MLILSYDLYHNCDVMYTAMNECRTNNGISPCKNGGICTDLVNAYVCSCSGGFQGTNCDVPLMGMCDIFFSKYNNYFYSS